MVFAAASDHIYLDVGHLVDFINKAFELLDHLGWEMAGRVLPSLVHGMARARRSQELSQWREPIDLGSIVWRARADNPFRLEQAGTAPAAGKVLKPWRTGCLATRRGRL